MVEDLALMGGMNGALKFLTACKILPLLDLLAKFKGVLACLCSQSFRSFSQARFLVSIAPSLGIDALIIPINLAIKFSGNARDK